jgi:hypothetical protein
VRDVRELAIFREYIAINPVGWATNTEFSQGRVFKPERLKCHTWRLNLS